MFQLVYTSKATKAFTLDELTELSNDAGERNRQINVTGMLIHHDGVFFQFLEGNEQIVRDLFDRISEDPRHTDCRIIYTHEANTRLFSNWFTRYVRFQYLKSITSEKVGDDLERLMAGEIEDKDELTRVLNKLISVVSARQCN